MAPNHMMANVVPDITVICDRSKGIIHNLEDHKSLMDFVKTASSWKGYDDEQWLPLEEIPWLNKSNFEEGVSVFENYYAGNLQIAVAMSVGLLISLKPLATIILREREETPNSKVYLLRFLKKSQGTIHLMDSFKNPEAMKREFYKIRKLHMLGAKRKPKYHNGLPLPDVVKLEIHPWMTKVVQAVKWDISTWTTTQNLRNTPKVCFTWDIPEVPISQLDVICTAFVTIGGMWMVPKYYGLNSREHPKIKCVFHAFAVFCRMFGIRDEFNIFIDQKPEVYKAFVQKFFVPIIEDIDEFLVALQSYFCSELEELLPILKYKPILCLAIEIVFFSLEDIDYELGKQRYPVQNLWGLLDWKERLCYYILKTHMWFMARSETLRTAAAVFSKWWLKWLISDFQKKVADLPNPQ